MIKDIELIKRLEKDVGEPIVLIQSFSLRPPVFQVKLNRPQEDRTRLKGDTLDSDPC